MNGVERGRRGIHILYEPSGGLGCCGGKHFHLDVVNRVGTVATVTPTVDGPVTSLPLTVMVQSYSKHGPTQVDICIYTCKILLQFIF